jgi:hypothetical protein
VGKKKDFPKEGSLERLKNGEGMGRPSLVLILLEVKGSAHQEGD